MKVGQQGHLSYCTNIHAGESWEATFENIKTYVYGVKQQVTPNEAFGIGLRLSNEAAIELKTGNNLAVFKNWLIEHDMYVFTMNGFPYGNFHAEVIKDQVHAPDWTTIDRKDYTVLLFDILAELIHEGISGGISTSPLSYKFWHKTETALEAAKSKACNHLIEVIAHLIQLKEQTGKSMHLDIEPEPDGIIEDSDEFIAFFHDYLLNRGAETLAAKQHISLEEAQTSIREHIQLCFDVCHIAVEFEDPAEVLQKMKEQQIGIGKIQLSAALKCQLNADQTIEDLKGQLQPFHEPHYLHQALIATKDGKLLKYPDLDLALNAINKENFQEIRMHFHVPIFLDEYQKLQSTQDDIIKTLELWNHEEFSEHLEIETYTWDVLPNQMLTNITDAIAREMKWVLGEIG